MKIVLLGSGGHAKVIASIVAQLGWQLVGCLDPHKSVGESWGQVSILGPNEHVDALPVDVHAVVAIGDNQIRANLFHWVQSRGRSIATVVHPRAIIDPSVTIGAGTVIMPGAIVNVDSTIGENCILNTGCTVDHDCRLGDHTHLCPGTHLAGGVTIGNSTMLGTGTNVIPGRTVGNYVIIGGGSLVNRDIPDGATAFGVPCRIKNLGAVG